MALANFLEHESLTASNVLGGIFLAYLTYSIGVYIYRLTFSQYAKFPGPKLAGLTYGYMFYYDYLRGDGQYMYKIKELHEEYKSPIIRISPHELHVIDPDFYDVLFAGAQSKRDKPGTWSKAFSNVESIFGTIGHEQHRIRRAALNPFFSPGALRDLESLVQDCVSRLIAVFRQYQKTGEPIEMKAAFGAMTSDIIAEYCFGNAEGYIEAPGFNASIVRTTEALTDALHITVQLQWLPQLIDSLPEWVVEGALGTGMAKLNEMKHEDQRDNEVTGRFQEAKYQTIFHSLLENPNLPEADKSVDRLWQEAQLLLAAGSVTTAQSISSAIVYLLLDPARLAVLVEELERSMPDITKPLKNNELEKLPYLNAVVQETLRLVTGVSYRLVRSAPSETLRLGDWTIPPNTAVSMHAPLIHHSEKVYPEPWSFIPERWLPSPIPAGLPSRPANIPPASQKYLVPLSKGTRQCLGLPLAHAELHMTLANILRNFVHLERNDDGQVIGVKGMKLFETDRRDTDMKREMGFPYPEKGRGNMRIILE